MRTLGAPNAPAVCGAGQTRAPEYCRWACGLTSWGLSFLTCNAGNVNRSMKLLGLSEVMQATGGARGASLGASLSWGLSDLKARKSRGALGHWLEWGRAPSAPRPVASCEPTPGRSALPPCAGHTRPSPPPARPQLGWASCLPCGQAVLGVQATARSGPGSVQESVSRTTTFCSGSR